MSLKGLEEYTDINEEELKARQPRLSGVYLCKKGRKGNEDN